LERVYETYTATTITSNASGISAASWVISPAGLLLAARLTGYQAIRDQMRIDKVQIVIHPMASASTPGLIVMYVERDPTAAVVATPVLALDQFEVRSAQSWKPLQVDWKPQAPSDKEFQNLNPGTVSKGTFFLLGNGAPVTTPIANATVHVWATLRGRP
jgi:hypothetical protein